MMRWITITILSSTLTLALSSGSVIIESPQSTRVSSGSPISLQCRIEEDNKYKIKWFKNGEEMDMMNSLHRMMMLPDGTLFFLSSEQRDSGKYYCVVTNMRDQHIEISYEAEVTVVSDDDYDSNDENDVVEEETEDAITATGEMDDGRIVMEIEASTVEKVDSVGDARHEIPLVFWVICLSVVSVMTLLVIFGAAFIICKIRNMKHHSATDHETGVNNIYERPGNKRLSWMETPWNFYPSSQQLKTFRNQKFEGTGPSSPVSNNSSDYDYASSDYFLLSKTPSEDSSHKYIFKSNHYASSNIK